MNKNHKTHYVTIGVIALAAVIIIAGALITPNYESKPSPEGVASLDLINFKNTTVEVGDIQKIRWTSTNYFAPTVAVNIIRKVGDNPARYELVRTVAPATQNDHYAIWVPARTDVGGDTFVEIGCTITAQECHASRLTQTLAVVPSEKYSNTANTYQAVEQLNNR